MTNIYALCHTAISANLGDDYSSVGLQDGLPTYTIAWKPGIIAN